MKQTKDLLLVMAVLFGSLLMTGCSDNPDPDPDPQPDPTENYHFDLWVALDRHGGMGRDVQTLVRSLANLDADQPMINFVGTGTEVNAILTLESIVKGPYYYQVPVSGDRFAKYAITDNTVNVIAQQQFKTNTYSSRKYTHAWLDDNTLLIMAANGDATQIIWTKLNADNMTIISEGTLDIPLPQDAANFTTSGIAVFRPSDNKLFYFYYGKSSGSRGARTTPFLTAVINPDNMSVISNKVNTLADEMVGSAYGELLQPMTMVDESGNIYLACFSTVDGQEISHLLMIPSGSTEFSPTYDGFTRTGKLIAVIYIGNGKALAYARDDSKGTDIDSFSHYYAVINLNTQTSSALSYNGSELPFSGGRFSCRMAAVDGKAYLGVNPETTNPCIYIYDAATDKVTLGAQMAEGYYFEQIRIVENLPN